MASKRSTTAAPASPAPAAQAGSVDAARRAHDRFVDELAAALSAGSPRSQLLPRLLAAWRASPGGALLRKRLMRVLVAAAEARPAATRLLADLALAVSSPAVTSDEGSDGASKQSSEQVHETTSSRHRRRNARDPATGLLFGDAPAAAVALLLHPSPPASASPLLTAAAAADFLRGVVSGSAGRAQVVLALGGVSAAAVALSRDGHDADASAALLALLTALSSVVPLPGLAASFACPSRVALLLTAVQTHATRANVVAPALALLEAGAGVSLEALASACEAGPGAVALTTAAASCPGAGAHAALRLLTTLAGAHPACKAAAATAGVYGSAAALLKRAVGFPAAPADTAAAISFLRGFVTTAADAAAASATDLPDALLDALKAFIADEPLTVATLKATARLCKTSSDSAATASRAIPLLCGVLRKHGTTSKAVAIRAVDLLHWLIATAPPTAVATEAASLAAAGGIGLVTSALRMAPLSPKLVNTGMHLLTTAVKAGGSRARLESVIKAGTLALAVESLGYARLRKSARGLLDAVLASAHAFAPATLLEGVIGFIGAPGLSDRQLKAVVGILASLRTAVPKDTATQALWRLARGIDVKADLGPHGYVRPLCDLVYAIAASLAPGVCHTLVESGLVPPLVAVLKRGASLSAPQKEQWTALLNSEASHCDFLTAALEMAGWVVA